MYKGGLREGYHNSCLLQLCDLKAAGGFEFYSHGLQNALHIHGSPKPFLAGLCIWVVLQSSMVYFHVPHATKDGALKSEDCYPHMLISIHFN